MSSALKLSGPAWNYDHSDWINTHKTWEISVFSVKTGENAFNFIKEVWNLCMVINEIISRFFPNVYKLLLNYFCDDLSCLVILSDSGRKNRVRST